MADLEDLALKRDRGYLLRVLLLVVIVGGVAGAVLFGGLTGERTGTCLADAFVGGGEAGPATPESPQ